MGGVQPIAFTLRFAGEAVELEDERFWAETRVFAPVEDERAGERPEEIRTDSALCRRNLEVRADGSLVQVGEITFGADDAITFRADGALRASPDPAVRHGTAVLEVTGGRGRLAGARGYVTSNFLLSDAGELTDHHLGLLFVERPVQEEALP